MRVTEIHAQLASDADLDAVRDALDVLKKASARIGGSNSLSVFDPLREYRLDATTRQLVLVVTHPESAAAAHDDH